VDVSGHHVHTRRYTKRTAARAGIFLTLSGKIDKVPAMIMHHTGIIICGIIIAS
jgi:hypothetical protein